MFGAVTANPESIGGSGLEARGFKLEMKELSGSVMDLVKPNPSGVDFSVDPLGMRLRLGGGKKDGGAGGSLPCLLASDGRGGGTSSRFWRGGDALLAGLVGRRGRCSG